MRISDWSSDVCSSDLQWKKSQYGSGLPSGMAEQDESDPRASAQLELCHPKPLGHRPARASHRSSHRQDQHRMRRSEEHTSELQSLMRISYAVFCLKKKNQQHNKNDSLHLRHANTQQQSDKQ